MSKGVYTIFNKPQLPIDQNNSNQKKKRKKKDEKNDGDDENVKWIFNFLLIAKVPPLY